METLECESQGIRIAIDVSLAIFINPFAPTTPTVTFTIPVILSISFPLTHYREGAPSLIVWEIQGQVSWKMTL